MVIVQSIRFVSPDDIYISLYFLTDDSSFSCYSDDLAGALVGMTASHAAAATTDLGIQELN